MENGADATLVAVGSRLRDIRKEAGLSLRDLATRSGMSASFLSLVERGECSLSLTSLFGIARALEIDPADVVGAASNAAPAQAEFGIWRAGDRPKPKSVVGEREYFAFSAAVAQSGLRPIFLRIHPTKVALPRLSHEGEEVAVVLSGTLTFELRDEIVELAAGDAIHLSSQTPHTILNRTDGIVEAIWLSADGDASAHHPSY